MSKNKNTYFTFDVKKTEGWTYNLTEEEYDRFKHLPTPCAVIGFKPKTINSDEDLNKNDGFIQYEITQKINCSKNV
jgi:hypothetical protein